MTTDRQFEQLINSWLQDAAPVGIPARVLDDTAKRTRATRQQVDWRAVLRRPDVPRSAPATIGAFVIVAAMALALTVYVGQRGLGPLADARTPFLGTWISTSDADGITKRLTVEGSADDAVTITVTDPIDVSCTGGPSTMTGSGTVEGDALVVAAPAYRCDDGTEPQSPTAPPPAERQRQLTYTRDAATNTLRTMAGDVWSREGAQAPDPVTSTAPSVRLSSPPGYLWPQTSLEELQAAQTLADTGKKGYPWWQRVVDEMQVAQHHPCSGSTIGCWSPAKDGGTAEIFKRFLEDVLGWKAFAWNEAFAHRAGLEDGEVVFVRCASGRVNSMYPTDPYGGSCAPTLDDLRYETVKIRLGQPGRQGPGGLWVVTGWATLEPAAQADPRRIEAEAKTALDRFLQARIDGRGAEGYADFPREGSYDGDVAKREIPLLYATTTDAPYERAETELVEGPVWPTGRMRYAVRMFADGGATTVEQHFTVGQDDQGHVRLVYEFGAGYGSDAPGTTENGKAVPVTYGFLDGEVTYRAAYPAGPSHDDGTPPGRLAITALLPDDQAPRRVLLMVADPRGCTAGPEPADAEAFARSIASNPEIEATAPVRVTIGGRSAWRMDVSKAGTYSCPLYPPTRLNTRLYLVDLPDGPARILAMAITADDDSFGPVLKGAAPIVDSIEIHPPS